MRKSNVFEAVKESVTTRQAAEYYGVQVGRNGMACCPFHDDKHPSMKVDRRFHCFGCQADGDVIDFTARLFGLSGKEAALKLAEDFSVRYDAKGHDPPRRRPVKRKISEELRYRQAEQKCFRVLCDYLHLLERWEKKYAPQTPEEAWNPLFVEALQKKAHTEYLLDVLLSGSMEERASVVAQYGKEVRKIEQRLFGFYLYKGNDLTATNTEGNTPCIFSRDFDNVNEQEYTASIENCGNFIYVQGAADDDGSQPVTTVDGEGATGLDLVEVFCDATDIARKYQQGETEVTIPLNTYIAMLKTRGGAELENYGKNINFVSTINTNSNLKFKADFDLGDRITCKETKWGIQIDARITEATETYQKGEETIEATFGDSLPTLVDQIRKVR